MPVDVPKRFLEALRRADLPAAAACFAPDGRLRALVPSALRDEVGPEAILDRFRFWWGDLERLELVQAEIASFPPDARIRYRLRGIHPADGPVEVEHEGYARVRDGLFERVNVVCSGFRAAR